ncbi:MAG TPA: YihY/virulence factor BrkB family protein [Rhizomicrobium sp.]|jgi:membrane protein|nr:YihY/virulence factor BrkB family protein [Rhizomicrobium sp.]
MFVATTWKLLKQGVSAFIEDGALSRGAAIAFYAATAFAPVLYIASAIAGLALGREAATGTLTHEIGNLIGDDGRKVLWAALHNTIGWGDKFWPNVIGVGLLIVTASGMFEEIQSALNAIWKTGNPDFTWWSLLRARLLSLALVLALGFLLLISLVATAALHALGDRIDYYLPLGGAVARALNFAITFVLMSALFAAIYKVLPDRELQWRDVIFGAVLTALLLQLGEYLISFYLGEAGVGARYGAAGGLIVLLTWIYYTAQIFLLGAEFTKVWSIHRGSQSVQVLAAPASS